MRYREFIPSMNANNSSATLGKLAGAGFRCPTYFALSSEGARLEVHHRTYGRLDCDLTGDPRALCSMYHRVITDMPRRYTPRSPLVADVGPVSVPVRTLEIPKLE
jgi:hypothetical protein